AEAAEAVPDRAWWVVGQNDADRPGAAWDDLEPAGAIIDPCDRSAEPLQAATPLSPPSPVARVPPHLDHGRVPFSAPILLETPAPSPPPAPPRQAALPPPPPSPAARVPPHLDHGRVPFSAPLLLDPHAHEVSPLQVSDVVPALPIVDLGPAIVAHPLRPAPAGPYLDLPPLRIDPADLTAHVAPVHTTRREDVAERHSRPRAAAERQIAEAESQRTGEDLHRGEHEIPPRWRKQAFRQLLEGQPRCRMMMGT